MTHCTSQLASRDTFWSKNEKLHFIFLTKIRTQFAANRKINILLNAPENKFSTIQVKDITWGILLPVSRGPRRAGITPGVDFTTGIQRNFTAHETAHVSLRGSHQPSELMGRVAGPHIKSIDIGNNPLHHRNSTGPRDTTRRRQFFSRLNRGASTQDIQQQNLPRQKQLSIVF